MIIIPCTTRAPPRTPPILQVCLTVHPSVHLSRCCICMLFVVLFFVTCLCCCSHYHYHSICFLVLIFCQSVHLSICLSVCNSVHSCLNSLRTYPESGWARTWHVRKETQEEICSSSRSERNSENREVGAVNIYIYIYIHIYIYIYHVQ